MTKKLHILINKFSGTVLRLGEAETERIVRDKFKERISGFEFVDAANMCKSINAVVSLEDTDLIVGGGDGSAVCAAEALKDTGRHFGILPLGTMNLLAQDLGSAPTFEETMERFESFETDTIDMGLVNGRFFLCSAVVGLVPESAVAREEMRTETGIEALSKFVSTIARGMNGDTNQTLRIRQTENDSAFDLETTSLIVSNNRFVHQPTQWSERFLRESLKDGNLAIYSAAPKDIMDGLRLMVKMVQGTWKEDEAVFSFETPEMIVDTPDANVLVSLDGEPIEMTSPLRFKIEQRKLPVLRMELS